MSKIVLGLLSVVLLACGPLTPEEEVPFGITDGTLDDGHPAVGLLLVPTAPDKMGKCTATLIGERTVLSAGHCTSFSGQYLFRLENRDYFVERVVPHPAFEPDLIAKIPPPIDIGVVLLSEAPIGVRPMQINIDPPRPGEAVELVGFGITAGGAKDGGIKRKASNVVEKVVATRFSIKGSGGGKGNLCQGDSGGPILLQRDGEQQVAGVTSATEGACGQSRSWLTRVDVFRDWIVDVAGGDVLVPDREPPTVVITAPEDGATLRPKLTVEVEVNDRSPLSSVELMVDGASAGSLTQGPFSFETTLSPGPRTLEVRATDVHGFRGQASVTVTVVAGDLELGQSCTLDLECATNLCHDDTVLGQKYCSRECDETATDPCPEGFQCASAGQKTLCLQQEQERPREASGCTVGPGRVSPGVLLLVLSCLLIRIRRCGV